MRTFKAPAVEAADLADKATALKSEDGAISGDLTEEGAKSFLTLGRRPNADAPAPKDRSNLLHHGLRAAVEQMRTRTAAPR